MPIEMIKSDCQAANRDYEDGDLFPLFVLFHLSVLPSFIILNIIFVFVDMHILFNLFRLFN